MKELVKKYRVWKLAHRDFPLTVQAVGQWSKKVRGKVFYFGPLGNPDAALQRWVAEKDYLLAGIDPPVQNGSLTVEKLLSAHLADLDERITAGKRSHKTRRDYLPLVDLFRGAGVLGIPVKAITPQHFTSVQRVLESSSRTLRTQKNLINSARSVFNWGGPDGMGLFDNAIHFGPRFRSANSLEIKVEQEEAGRIRFIDRDTINAAINGASEQMRVAILLGINCGFYPGDSVAITLDHLHMDGEIPYHDFRRVKTKERRMAALWKETVSAIKGYVETARWPIDAAESRLLLTQYGLPYTRAGEARKLIETFGRLLDRIGKRVRGVGLGSLRHTYATVVDDVPDQTMIDLTMGHTNANLQKGTYKQLNLNELKRLKVISEVVHSWLLGPGQ